MASESKDGQLEIVKQIKKVNEDGSYTIGYEADDGSFKIESRDVLGNIKGTYGFVDDDGEIKRVSYSTSNASEIVTRTEIPPTTVVQRIPRINRTLTSTTRKFSSANPTTQTPSTTTTVIQTIPRRRTTQSTTSSTTSATTEKPSYTEFIKAAVEASKKTPTKPPTIVYASPVPLKFQDRAKTTPSSHANSQKSEGQIIRPEISTDIPLVGRFILRNPSVLESESSIIKPVTEEPEVHGNLLRRQLQPDNSFDVQQHVVNLRQSHGADSTDVYSASLTTGTPRPLFTTTSRPQLLSSTTSRYPLRFHLAEVPTTQAPPEVAQETSTPEPSTTPTPVPAVQIPANRPPLPQEPLVALRHPQRGTILVPVSQLQGRDVQIERVPIAYVQPQSQYVVSNDRYEPQTQQVPVYIRRVPPPPLRSMPVQVDENGYVRELPPRPTSIPIGVTPTPVPQYISDDSENDIENIKPPVSVKDFQKLLEELIVRQTRLEQVSALTRRNPYYKTRVVYQQPPVPYVISRNPDAQAGPVQFIQQDPSSRRQYIAVPESQASQYQQQVVVRPQERQYDPIVYEAQPVASRRFARLHNPRSTREQDSDDGYLPSDVREMLLLKMLQLAINPALPLDVSDVEGLESATTTEVRKMPVRNVEILGEETEDGNRRTRRVKRYRKDY